MSETARKTNYTGLARRLNRISPEHKKVAIEMTANLAGVSLRVSKTFVEATPKACKILSPDDLRNWAEMGRKLAMANAESGADYFKKGVAEFKKVPEKSRRLVFQICIRQLVLSSSIAIETFESIPNLARQVADEQLFTEVLQVAGDVAQRSAKHSSDFLRLTPKVTEKIKNDREVQIAVIALASNFATRTGGMTADLWQLLPKALTDLTTAQAVKLTSQASGFLEFGGSVTLHFVTSGGEVLRRVDAVFDDWCNCLRKVAKHGNAILVSFLRATPPFFGQIGTLRKDDEVIGISRRILQLTSSIAESDGDSALACFRSAASALRKVSLIQFEDWVNEGLRVENGSVRAKKSYFALETRQSNDFLHEGLQGLPIDKVSNILRIYIEGLTGNAVEISPISAMPQESRINDGKVIYLPAIVNEFNDDELDFRLYKVLSAHGAGQIEFGTFERDSVGLKSAFAALSELYEATADEIDAFSLAGYIEDVQKGEKALSQEETLRQQKQKRKKLPKNSDYRTVLSAFPEPSLARKIFGTLENARIDRRLRKTYRGLIRDLDLMQAHLKAKRPYIFDIPMHQVPSELLFQITLCGGANDDARKFYGQVVSEIESVIDVYLYEKTATVADTLMATSRVYTLFQTINPEKQQQQTEESEEESDYEYDQKDSGEAVIEDKRKRENQPKQQDASDLFNAWNSLDEEGEPDDLQGAEAWTQAEIAEQLLEAGEFAFAYDEWDGSLGDYRIGWSRVVEKKVKLGERSFVELTRSRYRGVISSIRHQFQLMKPENLQRINRELDGEDYDLNALIDYVVDKRADGQQSERIYTKRLRRERDVAVSLLLDQSSSTARTITRNPMQPYTFPGKRIIEIEKEGLVLMSEALEAVGDVYSIAGFTSEGRRNVKFYNIKDFHEKYSDEVEKRIGGITFQNNTRLGAAIRHAAKKLLHQESRTKLLIILTDGRPYDHDYGDARYAREDVREALRDAKVSGITPFCITIDRESEQELKDLYGDVGYTIIDDVLSLPERLPNIYRRLTS